MVIEGLSIRLGKTCSLLIGCNKVQGKNGEENGSRTIREDLETGLF